MDLKQYSETYGRGFVRALAHALPAHEPDVSRWVAGKRPVPLRHAVAIEQFTAGHVSRRDLFPDTWQRIWPEAVAPTPTATAPAAQGAEQSAGVANA